MILAIDLGNYNIKTSEGVIFPSTFTEGVPANPIGEEILEFDGNSYTMTKGSFDNEFNKSKKNYLPNLLYAIAKSSTVEDKVFDIVLGVPLDNLGIANNFKEDLENKEFEVVLNGVKRKIKINRVAAVGEGISAYYTLTESERNDDVMIIDIGGRTTNVATFINKKLDKKFTVNIGMIDFYDRVKERVNSTGENFNTEEMERLIKKGIISDIEKEQNDLVDKIFNQIKFKAKKETYTIYFTGGGSIELREAILKLEPKGRFVPNQIFANVNGNKKIALIQWSDK